MSEKRGTNSRRRVPWAVFTLWVVWFSASLLTAGKVETPDIRRPIPEEFTQSLQLSEGLEVTLFISEPEVNNPTSMDIGDRGRLWVCDVLNYRAHQGRRPAGDRILILEDTTGDGNLFRQVIACRCNLDGSNLMVMGYNFRNPYELAVDSFGTVWQSDNDDDGNQGVRLNQILEHGNFGFGDELTGATWTVACIGASSNWQRRHWHQNDPGVVPNLLVSGGAGSPTGMTVYEGRLLPESIRNRLFHCDAGYEVCRTYTSFAKGGQPKLSRQDIVRGPDDHWFRPTDVAVAPDGSLFLADWHDPTVGSHRAGDVKSGRIYLIAPRGTGYHTPSYDFAATHDSSQVFCSPNQQLSHPVWKLSSQIISLFCNKGIDRRSAN